ncbi:MAG TPA: secondary thiamine-phosphate synthase enzyme YjbQ [Afifellaceae bacterium]|nr:secondary thiamine-phosphate synthase enzyme YjbQ [Afifellaceae bacterium]
MAGNIGPIEKLAAPDLIRATLAVRTAGRGMTDITHVLADFLRQAAAADGLLTLFIRHTSASLTIQENADPDVQADLLDALDHLAPEGFGWRHTSEGRDDMPAHVKAMLSDISLAIPVAGGRLQLGTWQGVYVIEHRSRPHRRELLTYFIGGTN